MYLSPRNYTYECTLAHTFSASSFCKVLLSPFRKKAIFEQKKTLDIQGNYLSYTNTDNYKQSQVYSVRR